ncbi:unnamed protein product [Clavelina lepadiformis]|uniref:Uncharacterized protein n=1 Tax=Clavelina lepadiformis TaxID=159417 RepID=A0ABP0GH36_CLALP
MEVLTSLIRPFKLTGCQVRFSGWPMMRTTTTHQSPREVDIQPITSNTSAMLRSAILHENQINRRSYAFILVLSSCKIGRRIREVMSSIPREVFMKSVDLVPRQLENLRQMRIVVFNFK